MKRILDSTGRGLYAGPRSVGMKAAPSGKGAAL